MFLEKTPDCLPNAKMPRTWGMHHDRHIPLFLPNEETGCTPHTKVLSGGRSSFSQIIHSSEPHPGIRISKEVKIEDLSDQGAAALIYFASKYSNRLKDAEHCARIASKANVNNLIQK